MENKKNVKEEERYDLKEKDVLKMPAEKNNTTKNIRKLFKLSESLKDENNRRKILDENIKVKQVKKERQKERKKVRKKERKKDK